MMSKDVHGPVLKTLKILLVDDLDINRLIIKEYLKNTTHEIVEVENGQLAVNRVKQEKFDVVLMDMQMPVMDGYTATAQIREWEQQQGVGNHLPIIAISAYALKEEQEKSLAVGCDQHLSKPLFKKTLMDTLETIVSSESSIY